MRWPWRLRSTGSSLHLGFLLSLLVFMVGALQSDGIHAQIFIHDSALSLNEDGETYVERVSLQSQPAGNVTVQISSADTTVVTVSPMTLTFTPSDYNQEQEVTYTAVDDEVANTPRRRTTITYTASGGGYDGASRTVIVALSDNESRHYFLDEGKTHILAYKVTVHGGCKAVWHFTSSDVSVITVAPSSLTWTPANSKERQSVTVRAVENDILGDTSATLNSRLEYAPIPPSTGPCNPFNLPDHVFTVRNNDDSADADAGSQLIFHANLAHTNYISVLNSADDKAVTVLVQYYNDETARVLWYLRVLRGGANVMVDPFDHVIPGTADEKGENGTHVGDFLGELPAASFTEKGGKFRPGVNSGRFLIVVTAVGAHSVDEDGDSTNTANTANILFPDFLAAGLHGTDNIDNCGNISLDGMGLGYTGNGPEGEFDCRKEDPDTPENEGDETTKNVGPLTVRNYEPVAFNHLLGHHTAAQVSSETGGVSWGVNALVRPASGTLYTVLDGMDSARLAPEVHGGAEGENAATDNDNLADDSGGAPVALDPTPSENNRVVNGGALILSSLHGGADENQRVEFLSAADDYGEPGEYRLIAAKTLYKVVLRDAMGNVLRLPSLVEPVFGGLSVPEPSPGLHILVDGLGVLPNASPEDCSGHERVEGWSLADLTGIVPSATEGTGDFTGLGARVDPATNASRGWIEFQRTWLTCTEDFGDGDPSASAVEVPDGVPTQDKRSFIGGTLVVEKGRENRTFVTAGQLVLKFTTPNSSFAASWWLTRK